MPATDAVLNVFRLAPAQIAWAQFSLTATRRLTVRFRQKLAPERLTRALALSERSYEALRTRFIARPGLSLPVQAIGPACGLLADQRPTLDAQTGRVAAAWLGADGLELTFEALALALDRPSLLRWSRSVAAAYAGHAIADTIQPADAAEGLAGLAEESDAEPARQFWRDALNAGIPPGRLPGEAGAVSGRIAAVAARRRDGPRAGDTARMLGLWQAWLRREAGLADITIGVERSGRDADLADALGNYTRILPVTFAGGRNDTLAACETAARAALDRAETCMLVAPQPDGPAVLRLGQLGFFPYGFCDETADEIPCWPGPEYRDATFDDAELPCALRLTLAAEEFRLAYDPARFSRAAAAALIARFQAFAEAASAQPRLALARLPRLAPDDLAAALRESRGAALAPGPGGTILGLISDIATRHPDRTAVIDATGSRSYRAFLGDVEAASHALVAIGVRRGDRVALVVRRSAAAIAGLLGILRAGAVAVPIDPATPIQHQTGLIGNVGCVLALAGAEQATALARAGQRVLTIEAALATVGDPAAAPSLPEREDGAYIIHTSGSTGQPKGVLVRHGNLLDSTRARLDYYAEPPRRFLLTPSLTFDSSVAGLYWTLATGGCLVLPEPGEERDAAALTQAIERHQVSHWLTIPALYHAVLGTADPRQLATLTDVIVAGEACPSALVAGHAAHLAHARLHNEYGPTEATVWSTCWSWDGGAVPDEIPIGRPIPGVAVYLLDATDQLVPDGAVGELHIGGAGVAAGYLGQPRESASAFRPDPFGAEPGARLYATRDLGRRQPDGTILYLGRIDRQQKIRGRRIEPREIEAALEARPGVMRAVVLVREGVAATRQLVGYVEQAPAHRLDGKGLRLDLASRLPDWMVPDAILVLDRFPSSANGKIDIDALPAMGTSARPAYRAPESSAETTLAGVVGDLIGVGDVGLDDDFFALGGDSLMALRVAAKLRGAGFALSVRSIFAMPRLAALATAMTPVAAAAATVGARAEDERPAPLTPIQRWFFARDLPQPRHYNHAAAFEAAKPLDPTRLAAALAVVVEAHPALRLKIETDEGGLCQRPMPIAGLAPPAWFDLRAVPEPLRLRLAHQKLLELHQTLDPTAGHMLRAVVFRLSSDRPDLLVTIAHHLAVDARSWQVFAEDLAGAYSGAAIVPAVGFTDWARALAETKLAPDGWNAYLAGADGSLPGGDAMGANLESEAAELTLVLPGASTQALARWPGGRTGRWLSDAVMAALGLVLGDWAGQDRLLIDIEGTGRDVPATLPDPSRTIGWLTTLSPVVLPHRPDQPRDRRLAAAVASIAAAPPDWTYALTEPGGPCSGAAFCVNFLGALAEGDRIGGLLQPVAFDVGALRGPRNPRAHLIELEVEASASTLRLRWRYAASRFDAATIGDLARRHLDLLSTLAGVCP